MQWFRRLEEVSVLPDHRRGIASSAWATVHAQIWLYQGDPGELRLFSTSAGTSRLTDTMPHARLTKLTSKLASNKLHSVQDPDLRWSTVKLGHEQQG